MPVQTGQQSGLTWGVPAPRRTTTTFSAPNVAIPSPPRARRFSKPHWGLRFVLLLFLLGGVTYFLRPSVRWIDARLTSVETGLRGLAARYGLVSLGTSGTPPASSTPAAPPVAAPAPAAPEPIPAVTSRAAAGSRPEVTPLPPRQGAAAAGAFGKQPGLRGPGRRFAQGPNGGALRPRGGPALTFRMRAAARRAAAARAKLAAASANYPRPRPGAVAATAPADSWDTGQPPPEPAAEPGPAARPPAPAVAEARPPAPPAPQAEEAAPPPRRSVVREAMRSGDELDRLMASAVVDGRAKNPVPARPTRRAEAAPASAPAAAAKEAPRAPLGRNEITAVMKDVQSKMNDCYRRLGQEGAADVRVEVAPDGSVAKTLVRGELANTPTATCVESKLKAAVFPPSAGIAFNYRLVVK
jgi:hypothetical protein